MPSFKIQADIFTHLSVFDSPKGSSNTFKTHKNISLYFSRRYLIIYKSFERFVKSLVSLEVNTIHESAMTSLGVSRQFIKLLI